MKSVRDIVNKMPDSKKTLEDYILNYSPEIRERVERNSDYRKTLERVTEEEFDKYSQYFGHLTSRLSGAGHAVGYAADAWLLTGDIIGSLGGKFINFLAQIPEKAYSVAYALKTGNYLDSMQNIFEGIMSYAPGLTVVDQGLTRIIQKRMAKSALYKIEEELGIEHQPWYKRVYDSIKDKYKDVKDRSENIISPRRTAPLPSPA